MNDGNAGVTLEVVKIESEDLAHLMNVHRSNDSSIVDLNAGDTVLKYKLSPSWEDLRCLGKKSQDRLKAIHVSSCLLGSEAETICVGLPRRGVPEFDEVLWKTEELLALLVERLHGTPRGCAQLRVKSLNCTNQHVGIDCDHRYQFSRRIAPSPTPGGA